MQRVTGNYTTNNGTSPAASRPADCAGFWLYAPPVVFASVAIVLLGVAICLRKPKQSTLAHEFQLLKPGEGKRSDDADVRNNRGILQCTAAVVSVAMVSLCGVWSYASYTECK